MGCVRKKVPIVKLRCWIAAVRDRQKGLRDESVDRSWVRLRRRKRLGGHNPALRRLDTERISTDRRPRIPQRFAVFRDASAEAQFFEGSKRRKTVMVQYMRHKGGRFRPLRRVDSEPSEMRIAKKRRDGDVGDGYGLEEKT